MATYSYNNDMLADYWYGQPYVAVSGLDASKKYDVTVYGACPAGESVFASRGSTFTLTNGTAAVTQLTATGTFADWTSAYVEGVSYVTFHDVTPVTYTYPNNTTVVGLKIDAAPGPGSDFAFFQGMQIAEVPEPSVLALLTLGLAGMIAYAWRKRK